MSTVNLKKLAVGMRTIEDLEMRLKFNIEKNGELIHITRNKPKRSEELCNGGSLFWVINRRVLVRQKILNIKQIIGDNNKFFAAILLENKIIKVRPTPMKPFQGWRYLKKNRTPADIIDPVTGTFEDDIPLEVQQQLLEVGLL